MSVKAKIEAIIYATEEPVTLNQLASLLKDAVLAEIRAEEEARLALNEIVSVPTPPDEDLDEEIIEFEFDEPEPDTPPAEAAPSTDAAPEQELAASPAEPPEPASPPVDTKAAEKEELKRVKERISSLLDELIAEYSSDAHGVEIRQIAGGYRLATKPEHHDVVIGFAKSLKPPIRLSLQALETLSVIAYKQPVTVPEISEVRGVDSAGVIATLLDRKLITTAGRKQVIGRPILYKTTKEFLLRFGLNEINELPSMEEFEKLGDPQAELFQAPEPEGAAGSAVPGAAAANEAANEQPTPQPESSSRQPHPEETPVSAPPVPEAGTVEPPVSEVDPALVSPENKNQPDPDLNDPARFSEAVAPVPGVDTLESSEE